MTLFPLDAVRNARIDRDLEPPLQDVRDAVSQLSFPDDTDPITSEEALDVFDAARPRLNAMLSLLQDLRGATGADISTGLGFLPVLLERRGLRTVATECDPTISAFAVRQGIEVRRYCIGRTSPPFAPDSLDFLVFAEVLEHLKLSPVAVVTELASLLKPGGRLLLTTPNVARRAHIEALVAGENFLEAFPEDLEWGADATDALEHVREYSVREVVEAVEAAGMAVDEVVMSGWGDAGYDPLPNPYSNEIIVVRATR